MRDRDGGEGARPRRILKETVARHPDRVLSLPGNMAGPLGGPMLVVLAAGKGTRFGASPKCVQRVKGKPLARHSVDAFRAAVAGLESRSKLPETAPVVVVVGYRHEEVAGALGDDLAYVLSGDPVGGTAYAAYEGLGIAGASRDNPLVLVAMGDRIVASSVFSRLLDTHLEGGEAALTFLTAYYEPPRNVGKGRIIRDAKGRVRRILEERDIKKAEYDPELGDPADITEGNCPLYVIRARELERILGGLDDGNEQGQFYLTDVVEAISREGGEIRTVTVGPDDLEYEVLCADVTRPEDLPALDAAVARSEEEAAELAAVARAVASGRPDGQIRSIARQIDELVESCSSGALGFRPGEPVSIGVSGGRMRIAFMHPDMGRFYGPAWQMPIGAGDESGEEQIVVIAQSADDRRIHLFPRDPAYQESLDSVDSDDEAMYPSSEVSDWITYEGFGTRMSEKLLMSLGYFSDDELDARRHAGAPLPPAALWISNNMRRPFTLVGNAISSIRTLRDGPLGERVEASLGRKSFAGLRLACTGGIPKGGFSSSSALTLATKNAIDKLYGLGIPPDLLISLACQAEYGTGVRAGSLDQATEQKGTAGSGTLISSNPGDGYAILGTHPVPSERFKVIYPYSVARDTEAWRWSWGYYARSVQPDGPLTAGELRKLTGKSAEIAALLVRLPLGDDFFGLIRDDLLKDGELGLGARAFVRDTLLRLPLLARKEELRRIVLSNREWLAEAIAAQRGLSASAALSAADLTLESLFDGWREPVMRRRSPDGEIQTATGIPLRAIVAYLFGEVAKNFRLIRHPEEWIELVSLSQLGDRCADIDPASLPTRREMESRLPWESGSSGPELLELWLGRVGAVPFDFDRGLDDATLSADPPPDPARFQGTNFFRGLALIDLAEAMLKRAFGDDAVAIRVNAAGQGDFFQVHMDSLKADPAEVEKFLRAAFYRRFGLRPQPEFVTLHPGGGACGVRVSRFDRLPRLAESLRGIAAGAAGTTR